MVEVEVLSKCAKRRKMRESWGVVPLFGDWSLVLVIERKGCDKFRELR